MGEQTDTGQEKKAFRDDHLAVVMEGVEAIVSWQAQHPKERLQLQGAKLRKRQLTKAYLRGAKLKGADLFRVNLTDANLRFADLSEAGMEKARLEGARLTRADLRDANLLRVGVVPLWRRIFTPWYQPFRLDDTYIRGARFEAKVSDPWSILRRNYTGPKFALHLLLLVVFMVPYAARGLYWGGINEMESIAYKSAVARVRVAHEKLEDSPDAQVQRWVSEAGEFLSEQQDNEALDVSASRWIAARRELGELLRAAAEWHTRDELGDGPTQKDTGRVCLKGQLWSVEARGIVRVLGPIFNDGATEWPMWMLMLGGHKGWQYVAFLILPVLVYNIVRGWLTYSVSLLRDAEERSGYSPRWKEYGRLYWVHQPARALMVVTMALVVYNAIHWLTAPVVMPE